MYMIKVMIHAMWLTVCLKEPISTVTRGLQPLQRCLN